MVEQASSYPHLSARENLEIIRRMRGLERSKIDTVLETVRLSDDADRPVKGFSLGMRQRLGLAEALIGEPELLILDEPNNGLDPAGIREMRDLIRQLPAQGITVFLSSHLLHEIEHVATHIGVIKGGVLVWQGTAAELEADIPGTDLEERYLHLTTGGRSATIEIAAGSSTDNMSPTLTTQGEL
jgi:ABC-2 type transport system ATP-binding protein